MPSPRPCEPSPRPCDRPLRHCAEWSDEAIWGGASPLPSSAPYSVYPAGPLAPPLPAGVQRGAAPWAGGLEGVPPDLQLLSAPFLIRKGARGMVSAPFEAKPLQRRVQRGGASLPGVSGGCPPDKLPNGVGGWEEPCHSSSNHPPGCQRESRGAQPLWQEVWRVSLQSS